MAHPYINHAVFWAAARTQSTEPTMIAYGNSIGWVTLSRGPRGCGMSRAFGRRVWKTRLASTSSAGNYPTPSSQGRLHYTQRSTIKSIDRKADRHRYRSSRIFNRSISIDCEPGWIDRYRYRYRLIDSIKSISRSISKPAGLADFNINSGDLNFPQTSFNP